MRVGCKVPHQPHGERSFGLSPNDRNEPWASFSAATSGHQWPSFNTHLKVLRATSDLDEVDVR